MKLEKFLQDNYGYNPEVRDAIQSYIDLWKSCYAGNIKDFQNYYIYNGRTQVPKKRFSLNMPKSISEDWADILWSEKCKISMKDDKNQQEFDKLVDELDLYAIINQLIERSGALGTSMEVTSVYDIVQNNDKMTLDVSNAKTRTDIVDIDWIYPLTWNNKEITECAFGSVEYIGGKKYVVCSVHKIADNGNYVIYNHLFSENNGNLTEIEQDDGTVNAFDTENNIKWFSRFKPALTNNLFSNSPFGIPYYANAIDKIKACDICFDALKTELNDGRRRTFVRADLMNYDSGEQKLTFDPNDTDIYVLPSGASKDDLIQNDTSELRSNAQIEALNTNLNMLGDSCGFGLNHYTYNGVSLQTATAVISSNSKMFRRKKKLEIGYESAIYDLIKSVCYASTKFGKYNIDTEGMVIQFDDSIIEDTEQIANRKLREVNAGIISKEEYRQVVLGETSTIAEEAIRKVEEEKTEDLTKK